MKIDKRWVILVDDDEDDRFLVQQAFKHQSAKYVLQCLPSGDELFHLLAESVSLPALLLLDVNMPVMDGFAVLRQLRAHPDYAGIVTVLLTTSDAESDRRRARELGANRFLTKPPTLEQLTKMITQLKQEWLMSK